MERLRLSALVKDVEMGGDIDVIIAFEAELAVKKLQATVEALQREVNTLNQLLRDKGLGQGEIDGMAAEHDELQALRDERARLREALLTIQKSCNSQDEYAYWLLGITQAALTPAGGGSK